MYLKVLESILHPAEAVQFSFFLNFSCFFLPELLRRLIWQILHLISHHLSRCLFIQTPRNQSYYDMSFESDVLGYFIPTVILSQMFSKFLSLTDVSRFDTAICNRSRRPLFLECIRSKSCIWLGDKEQTFSSDAISWLTTRSIKIRLLRCRRVTYDIAVKISHLGRSLHWLSIENGWTSDRSVAKLVEGCPNLQNLILSNPNQLCFRITDLSIIKISEECANLQMLDLDGCHNITDLSITRIAEMCHNLNSLILNYCTNISDTSIIRIAEECPNLHKLSLGNCPNITDSSIIRIAEGCINLQKLDLRYCVHITDASIIAVAEGCYNLQELYLSGCDNVTDGSISRVAERCVDLQKLRLYSCRNITSISLTNIRENCPSLQDLGHL